MCVHFKSTYSTQMLSGLFQVALQTNIVTRPKISELSLFSRADRRADISVSETFCHADQVALVTEAG